MEHKLNKLFLFGLSGSGKNFIGEILEKRFSYKFIDCDQFIIPEMADSIRKNQPFTDDTRDNFFSTLNIKIKDLIKIHEKIAFAQGAYKNKHRIQILEQFPEIQMIYIKANPYIIWKRFHKKDNLNLNQQENDSKKISDISKDYAEKILINFEEPTHKHMVIVNEVGEEDVVKEIKEIFR